MFLPIAAASAACQARRLLHFAPASCNRKLHAHKCQSLRWPRRSFLRRFASCLSPSPLLPVHSTSPAPLLLPLTARGHAHSICPPYGHPQSAKAKGRLASIDITDCNRITLSAFQAVLTANSASLRAVSCSAGPATAHGRWEWAANDPELSDGGANRYMGESDGAQRTTFRCGPLCRLFLRGAPQNLNNFVPFCMRSITHIPINSLTFCCAPPPAPGLDPPACAPSPPVASSPAERPAPA